MILTSGQLKQDLLRIYNEINKDIFRVGVKQQRVDFIGCKIVILSMNPRIPALKLLDQLDRSVTRHVDYLLFEHFKARIRQALEHEFHMNIVSVLKDYDVSTGYSGTIVILDRDVQSYLNDSSELP